ncbi:amidohydrolase family protein [Erysipelothrix aquatica]|uniref:amidohydrolase family protein n=1 Tax=Erysipelothrix aquatica TaxID=2683714 RepID=UPI00135A9698|nr:amidohydrolase family protein [Erysipelothrix aquatica]
MTKIFDSHFHIINKKYPIIENQGFIPNSFLVNDYIDAISDFQLEITGGVVVSGSYHGYDQTYFVEAIESLTNFYQAPFVGVTQLPLDTSMAEIKRLNEIGIRAVRFNLYRGQTIDYQEVINFANKIYDAVKWKVEFYLDFSNVDQSFMEMITALPKASIDHMGLSYESLPTLKKLLSEDIAIRISGFGRIDYTNDEIVLAIRELYEINEELLIFGSDIPSTRAKRPFMLRDVQMITDALGAEAANKVLFENGLKWYVNE